MTNAVTGLAVAQARLGAKVAVMAAEPDQAPLYEPIEELLGVEIIKWRPQWRARIGQFRIRGIPTDASSALAKWSPDVVHIHGEFNADNLWVPRLFSGPIVLSPHGAFHPVVLKKSSRRLKLLYIAAANRLLYTRVARFHALSPMEQAHIASAVPTAHIYCVPQGPNLAVDEAAVAPMADEGMERRSVSLVFVGRLDVFTKGLDILLQAFARAKRTLPLPKDMALTLIGPDWRGGMRQLKAQARDLGIADCVSFTGAIRSANVKTHLAHADVYIQTSRHDSFPLSVAEALTAGKPAILSKAIGITSFPEIASLRHVRIVTPAVSAVSSAIVDVVTHIREMKSAAQESHDTTQEFFSWRRAAMEHLNNYPPLMGHVLERVRQQAGIVRAGAR